VIGILGVGGVPAAFAGPSPGAIATLSEAARNLVPAQSFQLTLPTPTPSPVAARPRPHPRPRSTPRAAASASPLLAPTASPTASPTANPTAAPSPHATASPQPSAAVSPRAEIVAVPPSGSIAGDILAAAQRFGVSYTWLLGVATCESGLDPLAVNGSSGATGLFQFMPSTFYGHGGTDIWSPVQQANVAASMFAAGESNQWACA